MNRLIHKAMFVAPWWAAFINPHFLPRRALWRAMVVAAPKARGRLLDVGCGRKPYQALFAHVKEYLGLELDTPKNRADASADLFYDGQTIPLNDASVDTVLCNQVLEHVQNPTRFLGEINRVLSPGGALILTVPFFWPEHEQPHDHCRFTSFGLRTRLQEAGFSVQEQHKLTPGLSALMAIAADQLNSIVRPAPVALRLLVRFILLAPLSLLGWSIGATRPVYSELYLDNFVVCTKNP